MKETILLINFNDTARRNQVKRALMPLRLRLKSVGPDQYDLPVGVLAGEKQTGQQRDQQEGKTEGAGREDLSARPSSGSSDGRGEPCETAAEAPPDE